MRSECWSRSAMSIWEALSSSRLFFVRTGDHCCLRVQSINWSSAVQASEERTVGTPLESRSNIIIICHRAQSCKLHCRLYRSAPPNSNHELDCVKLSIGFGDHSKRIDAADVGLHHLSKFCEALAAKLELNSSVSVSEISRLNEVGESWGVCWKSRE